jgi:hypothetical protein
MYSTIPHFWAINLVAALSVPSLVQVIITESVMPNTGDGVASSDITVMVIFVEDL